MEQARDKIRRKKHSVNLFTVQFKTCYYTHFLKIKKGCVATGLQTLGVERFISMDKHTRARQSAQETMQLYRSKEAV
jgi:hypothetical protein